MPEMMAYTRFERLWPSFIMDDAPLVGPYGEPPTVARSPVPSGRPSASRPVVGRA